MPLFFSALLLEKSNAVQSQSFKSFILNTHARRTAGSLLAKLPSIAFILLTLFGASVRCFATAPGVTSEVWISKLSMQSMGSVSFSIQANPVGGVTIPTSLSGATGKIVSGLPAGVTASWSKPTLNQWGAALWTVTLTGSTTAVASSETLQMSLTVTDAHSGLAYAAGLALPLSVSLTPAKLSISSPVGWVAAKQTQSARQVFSFTTGGSFHGNVSLTISGLPAFVTASWSSNPVTITSGAGSSTLTLSPSSTATINWFKYTVTASGDGVSVSQTYTIEIKPLTGEQVTVSAPVLTIEPSSSQTVTVTATPIHGIQIPSGATGTTASVASGLPSGVTASWSSPTLTSAGAVSWTLTLKASSSVLTGGSAVVLAVQITDSTSGVAYLTNPGFTVLVSLMGQVSVGSTPGQTIPNTFMGLSHEWGDAQYIMGNTTQGVNQIYRQLLANLTAYGSGPINIRIGGDTTDTSGEPTAATIPPLAELAAATGSKFELGVNLGSNNVSLATDQAKAYLTQMPAGSIAAIEIGNEPDWYTINGLRPASYTVQDYYTDFSTWKQSIQPLLPTGTKLMGASWAIMQTLPNAPSFISNFSTDLNLFSQHFYATNPTSAPAIDFLLAPASSTTGPSQVSSTATLSHQNGFPLRIGETGAISNGGIQSIGQAFGATLWSIDTMFEYAKVCVDGVNWEASTGNYNNPFTFSMTSANGGHQYGLVSVNPLYYGMLFFQEATTKGSRILPVQLTTPANLKAFAVLPASGAPRVVLINKDENTSGNVSVSVPGYEHATVLRLTAPSYTSSTGIMFAGQTFDGSPDGTIQGTQSTESITGANGVFQIPMSITSAALVIFSE